MIGIGLIGSKKGYSLIELMIVVVIITILASIAIPSYEKMRAKARSAEAKLHLGAMFSALKVFHNQFNSYSFCLYQLGYEPNPGNRYYIVGFFNDPFPPSPFCGGDGATSCTAYDYTTGNICSCAFPGWAWNGTTRNDCTFFNSVSAGGVDTTALAGAAPYVWSARKNTFTVGAIGNIVDATLDVWTIDQTQSINNPQRGY